MTALPGPEPLVSMAATAAHLGVSLETFRRWRKYGGGPKGYPLGRHVNFRLSEVDEWLKQRREAS
jgi:excisionase family DNA binding protein